MYLKPQSYILHEGKGKKKPNESCLDFCQNVATHCLKCDVMVCGFQQHSTPACRQLNEKWMQYDAVLYNSDYNFVLDTAGQSQTVDFIICT